MRSAPACDHEWSAPLLTVPVDVFVEPDCVVSTLEQAANTTTHSSAAIVRVTWGTSSKRALAALRCRFLCGRFFGGRFFCGWLFWCCFFGRRALFGWCFFRRCFFCRCGLFHGRLFGWSLFCRRRFPCGR